jgi:hypothetical protein
MAQELIQVDLAEAKGTNLTTPLHVLECFDVINRIPSSTLD